MRAAAALHGLSLRNNAAAAEKEADATEYGDDFDIGARWKHSPIEARAFHPQQLDPEAALRRRLRERGEGLVAVIEGQVINLEVLKSSSDDDIAAFRSMEDPHDVPPAPTPFGGCEHVSEAFVVAYPASATAVMACVKISPLEFFFGTVSIKAPEGCYIGAPLFKRDGCVIGMMLGPCGPDHTKDEFKFVKSALINMWLGSVAALPRIPFFKCDAIGA
ncbi:hypothetical protein JKP88DRAFT_277816 [Tribonema minus]|uniref:Uncharacterized protein n=1 Tax=Tribonema minus TaxID=303371 RepID=A0A836CEZ7_9STRA|nr:hypothetical protein JKP88DRAFT_277816 [Tribonema minus]